MHFYLPIFQTHTNTQIQMDDKGDTTSSDTGENGLHRCAAQFAHVLSAVLNLSSDAVA